MPTNKQEIVLAAFNNDLEQARKTLVQAKAKAPREISVAMAAFIQANERAAYRMFEALR